MGCALVLAAQFTLHRLEVHDSLTLLVVTRRHIDVVGTFMRCRGVQERLKLSNKMNSESRKKKYEISQEAPSFLVRV